MITKRKAIIIAFFLFTSITLTVEDNLFADVIVHDIIAIKNEKVMLKAEITRGFSKKGGEIVEFYIKDDFVGKTLSGGDGVAYKEYLASKKGLLKIKVKSANDENIGFLLVLDRKDKIILIEFEESFLDRKFLEFIPKTNSQLAIKEINKRYPIIIIQSGFLNKAVIRKWFRKYEYPDLPIISIDEKDLIDSLVKKGIIIKATIGGKVVDIGKRYNSQTISFKDIEGTIAVSDWVEIKKIIFKKNLKGAT
ncbi:MAG: hypothetical protein N3A59_03685 [Thermodesulfovibrionales bacterium]|nr:hypothetical protein [Thermodesulfovibrionales bacterium]